MNVDFIFRHLIEHRQEIVLEPSSLRSLYRIRQVRSTASFTPSGRSRDVLPRGASPSSIRVLSPTHLEQVGECLGVFDWSNN